VSPTAPAVSGRHRLGIGLPRRSAGGGATQPGRPQRSATGRAWPRAGPDPTAAAALVPGGAGDGTPNGGRVRIPAWWNTYGTAWRALRPSVTWPRGPGTRWPTAPGGV